MELQLIDTPVGALTAAWTEKGLYSCEFLRDEHPPQETLAQLSEQQFALDRCIQSYFQSGIVEWDLAELDWTDVSKFHRKTLEHCFAIPCGKTTTYGRLAHQAGSPLAARAVGGAMAKNRWPILIPCHRVVGASGQLTGYSGLGGVDTKRHLLELEQSWAGAVLFA